MASAILIDIALLAVLLFFTLMGARRGFVLTLCSLVALLVALVGADLVSSALAPRAAAALQPRFEQSIQESLEQKALEVSAQDSLGVADVLAALRDKGGLYEWAADSLEEALINSPGTDELAHQAAVAAATVAERLARGALFAIAFLLILIAWFFLSHALDLVARLPGLNSLNHALGGAAGFCKGLLLVYLACWILCPLTGLIPRQTAEQTHLLLFLIQHSPLDIFSLL